MPISTLKISNIKPNAKQINSDYDGTTMDREKKTQTREVVIESHTNHRCIVFFNFFAVLSTSPMAIVNTICGWKFSIQPTILVPLEYTSKSQVFKSFIVYLLSLRLMNTQVCLFVWIDTILLFNLFVRLFGFWIDMIWLDSTRLESTRRSQMPIENRYVHFVRWDSLRNSQLRKTLWNAQTFEHS